IKVNYFANALTVFLRDDQIGADLKIFDLQGKLVMEESIEGLYSFPLGDEPKGTYILTIEDKIGRKEKLKLVNF
ncbi:MAG: T9SS type A sorting domain-containing protein, partial [Flavobacteriales bacterium]|nr:T9SS type A sorting domain-containing protein [Flavobacteriales bacterium]